MYNWGKFGKSRALYIFKELYPSKYFLGFKSHDAGQIVLNKFLRGGRLLKMKSWLESSVLIMHISRKWGFPFFWRVGSWGYMCYCYFYHIIPLFDKRILTLQRKAGTRRSKFGYRLKFIVKERRWRTVGLWFDIFQDYFYGRKVDIRIGKMFYYLCYGYWGNLFWDWRYWAGRKAVEMTWFWRRRGRRFFYKNIWLYLSVVSKRKTRINQWVYKNYRLRGNYVQFKAFRCLWWKGKKLRNGIWETRKRQARRKWWENGCMGHWERASIWKYSYV